MFYDSSIFGKEIYGVLNCVCRRVPAVSFDCNLVGCMAVHQANNVDDLLVLAKYLKLCAFLCFPTIPS